MASEDANVPRRRVLKHFNETPGEGTMQERSRIENDNSDEEDVACEDALALRVPVTKPKPKTKSGRRPPKRRKQEEPEPNAPEPNAPEPLQPHNLNDPELQSAPSSSFVPTSSRSGPTSSKAASKSRSKTRSVKSSKLPRRASTQPEPMSLGKQASTPAADADKPSDVEMLDLDQDTLAGDAELQLSKPDRLPQAAVAAGAATDGAAAHGAVALEQCADEAQENENESSATAIPRLSRRSRQPMLRYSEEAAIAAAASKKPRGSAAPKAAAGKVAASKAIASKAAGNKAAEATTDAVATDNDTTVVAVCEEAVDALEGIAEPKKGRRRPVGHGKAADKGVVAGPAKATAGAIAKKGKQAQAVSAVEAEDDFVGAGASAGAAVKGKGKKVANQEAAAGPSGSKQGKGKAKNSCNDEAGAEERVVPSEKRGAPDPATIPSATWIHGLPVNLEQDTRVDKLQEVDALVKLYYQYYREAQLTEHERYANAGGRHENGKKMSKRPDLVALSRLRKEGKFINKGVYFGHVPGIPVNARYHSRAEIMAIGLHAVHMKGIDYAAGPDVIRFLAQIREQNRTNNNPLGPAREASVPKGQADTGTDDIGPICISVVVSGVYGDDKDSLDNIEYTGEGGNDYLGNKRQVADQKLTGGNKALANNCTLGIPVRLIRKNEDKEAHYSVCYIYDGLYDVTKTFTEKGKDGFLVYKYNLRRCKGQPAMLSKEVQFGDAKNAPPQLDPKSRPCVVFTDLSRGKEEEKVPVVNELDAKNPKRIVQLPPGIDPVADKDSEFLVEKNKVLKKAEYDFEYVNNYAFGDGVPQPEPPVVPADLLGMDPHDILKAVNAGVLPYQCLDAPKKTRGRKKKAISFLSKPRSVTFECGDWTGCKLGAECPQRVVQNGLQHRLEVFHTGDRGWGVRTWDFIPEYTFICAFYGELHPVEETDEDSYLFECVKRPDFDKQGNFIPLAQRDPDVEYKYQVDARRKGNVARFINHSCNPNTFVQPTCINTTDEDYCVIAFFAMSNIPPWTELTYDYGPQYVEFNLGGKCRCGAPTCSYHRDTAGTSLRNNLAGWQPHLVQEKNKQKIAKAKVEANKAATTLQQLFTEAVADAEDAVEAADEQESAGIAELAAAADFADLAETASMAQFRDIADVTDADL